MSDKGDKAKLPPQNIEAEQSVLGAVLIDKDCFFKIAETVIPDDFYRDDHREIFSAMVELFEERAPVDLVTLTEKLKKKNRLEQAGGATYISHIASSAVSSAHVVHHAQIVAEKSTLRRLIKAATRIIEDSFGDQEDIPGILDRSEQVLFAVSQKFARDKFVAVKDILVESFDRINELHENRGQLRGVPSGFRDMDNLLAGFQKSDLVILAARPSMGKTSLALNIASHASSREKVPVGIFSLEMSRDQLVDSLMVMEAGIDSWRLRTGNLREDDFSKLNHAMGVLSEAPLYIDDTPVLTVMDIRAKARRLQAENGLGLVIVDYLQLMEGKSRGSDHNRVQEVSDISRGLKALARELDVPVVALSQLSRAVEARHPKIPQLADLRDSGCLTGETLVYNSFTGKRERIDSLVGSSDLRCLAMDERYKSHVARASKIFSTGKKKVFKMMLSSGKFIKATGNHKFMTVNGWRRLDELSKDDLLATPRRVSEPKLTVDMSDNKIILLAHLIGDGCYLKRQPLHYTNKDQLCLSAVDSASKQEFNTKNRWVKQDSWYHIYLSSPCKLARGIRNPIAKWLDEELSIFDQRSGEKEIPEMVFRLNNNKLSLFIKHLFATDGGLTKSSGQWRLHYASKSRKLVEGLQHLLLRFEIHSIIKESRKKGYQVVYDLVISGQGDQMRFFDKIGIFGLKQNNVEKARAELLNKKENTNIDVIDKVIWEKIKEIIKKKGWTHRDFHGKMNWSYSGTSRYKHSLSRDNMGKIASVLNSDELMDLAKSDVFWEKIASIEPVGVEEVYDITVPGLHNFSAQDIVVHNSIEQDADVVMFIYREEYYDPETENKGIAKILIKKHRNGPIGDIDLFFNPEYRRFTTIEKKREGGE